MRLQERTVLVIAVGAALGGVLCGVYLWRVNFGAPVALDIRLRDSNSGAPVTSLSPWSTQPTSQPADDADDPDVGHECSAACLLERIATFRV